MKSVASRGGAALTFLVLAVAGIGVLILSGRLLATGRVVDARDGWSRSLGTLDDVLERFPATEANATALELEREAAALGVPLAPRWLAERAPADPEAQERFGRLKRVAFSHYATAQLEHTRRGAVDAPPPLLLEFMETYGAELDALRTTLLQEESPVWESDLSKLTDAPIPNLLGQIDLHKLLNAIALTELHAGNRDAALRSIEASWRLSHSLRDSPLLICQMIYLAATRLQIGTLRQVRDVPEVWLERLREHDFRESFLTAVKFEGWHWAYFDEGQASVSHGRSGMFEKVLAPIVAPFTTLAMADVSDALRKRIEVLENVTTLCDRDLAAEGLDLSVELPFWNVLGDVFVPNLQGAIERVARLEVDLELLMLAIEADRVRRDTGRWPDPDDVTRTSAACPDDRWMVRRSGPRLEIALSREIGWPRLKVGADLPRRIELD